MPPSPYLLVEHFRLKVLSTAYLPLDDEEVAAQRQALADHRHATILSGKQPDPEIDALNEMLLEEHVSPRLCVQIMQEYLEQRSAPPSTLRE